MDLDETVGKMSLFFGLFGELRLLGALCGLYLLLEPGDFSGCIIKLFLSCRKSGRIRLVQPQ